MAARVMISFGKLQSRQKSNKSEAQRYSIAVSRLSYIRINMGDTEYAKLGGLTRRSSSLYFGADPRQFGEWFAFFLKRKL